MELLPELCQKLQTDITSNAFEDVMPPIRVLAQQYNVGISTMKLALKRLKEAGYLSGHQGKCIKVNPQAVNNLFFQKNIVFFINLTRLHLSLYTRIIDASREIFETAGAHVYLINSLQQLKLCHFDIDILIVTESRGEELQYIVDHFPAGKIIFLNGYSRQHSNVATDNFHAGYEAVKYLHEEKNHNIIGILSRYLDYEVSFNKFRRDGAKEYCRLHPEVKLFEVDTENFDSVYNAVDDLFLQNADITAIFATMDTLAFDVYAYARAKDISIPEQLAVLGFDDLSFCRFTIPPLSTFQEDAQSITQALLKITQDKLRGDYEIKQFLFMPALIKRDSIEQITS